MEKLCDYGCGNIGTFKLANEKHCCSAHFNKCSFLRVKNSEGNKKVYKAGRIGFFKNNEEARAKSHESHIKNLKEKPFEQWGKVLKRQTISEEQNNKCCQCGIEEIWNGSKLIFELDHIDGNNKNNLRENLRLLCPNCHSQTPTFRGRGRKGWSLTKVEEQDIIEKIKEFKSINKVLDFFNYGKTKGVYNRIYRIINKNNLNLIFEDEINKKINNKIKQYEIKIGKKKQKLESEANKIKELENFIKNKKTKNRKLPEGHQAGETNSQFGTCWINNPFLMKNKKIKKEDLEIWIEQNWLPGRKMLYL